MGQTLVTIAQYARRTGYNERTIRNFLGEGMFTGFKMPGARGVLIDVVEADAALTANGRSPRSTYGQYGPNAKIVDLSRRVVAVESDGAVE